MAEKRKTGIMGGSFNPIHYGHLLMAETALEAYGLDEVCFIPTGLQWMKKDDPDLLSPEYRLELTKRAIKDHPFFTVSRIEIDREGATYTCETLAQLHAQQPDTEWYFIIGADTLANMVKWKNPEDVFSQAVILCATRDHTDREELSGLMKALAEKYHADIRFLDMPRMDISSTWIRRRVKEGRSIRYLVPEDVRMYIEEKRLYLQG